MAASRWGNAATTGCLCCWLARLMMTWLFRFSSKAALVPASLLMDAGAQTASLTILMW